jgi:hypothetical protein
MVLVREPTWTAQLWPAWTRKKSEGQTQSTAAAQAAGFPNVIIAVKMFSYYNNFIAGIVVAAHASAFQAIPI